MWELTDQKGKSSVELKEFSKRQFLRKALFFSVFLKMNTYLQNELFMSVMGSDMFVESYEIQIKLRQTLISKEARN